MFPKPRFTIEQQVTTKANIWSAPVGHNGIVVNVIDNREFFGNPRFLYYIVEVGLAGRYPFAESELTEQGAIDADPDPTKPARAFQTRLPL